MRPNPKITFSIVIPAYNAADVIVQALASVRMQTFRDFEVIVVDDGSTDNTKTIVDSYLTLHSLKGKCVRQPNKKIAGARNTGINLAKGEYIAFLDSDDIWYPDKLNNTLNIFTNHPEIDLVCHDLYLRRGGKIITTLRHGFRSSNRIMKAKLHDLLLFRDNCLSTSAVVVRKEKVSAVGGFRENPEFNSVEDYDLWIRLSLKSNFYFLHDILGEYRIAETNITQNIEYHLHNAENLLNTHFKDIYHGNPRSYAKWKIRRRLATLYRLTARRFLEASELPEKQREYIFKMLTSYPLNIKNLAVTGWWVGKSLRAVLEKAK